MQKFNIQWTAKTLVRQMEKGNVNFDNAVQRGLVWDVSKKSLLIHSMIYGFAIPSMYFTRDENGIYDSLDGKQRSNSISEYMNDEFSLTVDTPKVYDDEGHEEDISGMTFSQLPEWAQDRIKDYSLTIYYYEGMTDQEVKEFFRRLNNGKPLSAVELTRVNTPSLSDFQELAKHSAIKYATTDAAKKRFKDEQIAMQIYHILTSENPDFSTKSFRQWAHDTIVDHDTIDRIKYGLDGYNGFINYFSSADEAKVLKKVKTRTNFVSCALFFSLAVYSDMSKLDKYHTLYKFFSGKPSTSDDYNRTVGSGSAKPTAVKTRRDVIKKLVDDMAINI